MGIWCAVSVGCVSECSYQTMLTGLGLTGRASPWCRYKFYTPLAYSKPDSQLAPLAGGKVVSSTVIEDEHGHHLDAAGIPAGSKVKLILSLNSLYFSAETKCKISVKVERVQLVEAGTDVAEVADYSFDH